MKNISVLLFLLAIIYTYYFQESSVSSPLDPHYGEFWIAVSVFLFLITEIFLKKKPSPSQEYNNAEAIEDIIKFTQENHIDMANIDNSSREKEPLIDNHTVKKDIPHKNTRMKVVYRIKGIGHDQTEEVNTTSESEARRIIKAKYPSTNIHISTITYVRD